jgi:CubicO group peptidase (beta-lactamase class C family)
MDMALIETPQLARRELLRMSAYASLGALMAPQFAFAQGAGAQGGGNDPMRNVAAFMDRWVGPGKFPGLVTSLGLPGQPTQFTVRGSEGFIDSDPMTPDSLFRIYSMTKPITGMAAMMLIDEGKLGLDQPLAEILPKFARMQVQVTPDGSISELRPAKAAITIRNLLTHPAGLGYSIMNRRAWYRARSAGYGCPVLMPGQQPRPWNCSRTGCRRCRWFMNRARIGAIRSGWI